MGLALSACELSDDDMDPYECNELASTATVEGIWKLTGTGERNHCDDDDLDGKHIKLSSKPLKITQSNGGLLLSNYPAKATTFHFTNASVKGDCVNFKTLETGPDGSIEYQFSGRFVGNDVIEGKFEGDGPGGCDSDGTFEVSISSS